MYCDQMETQEFQQTGNRDFEWMFLFPSGQPLP